MESRHPCRLEEDRRRGKIHRLGNRQGLHQARCLEGGVGQCAARHPNFALSEPGISKGRAVRQVDAGVARPSLYQSPENLKVAPFAMLALASVDAADPNKPTVQPVPYVGVQYAAIPEFQGIGTTVGQQFSAALSGSSTVDAALSAAQSATEREMKRAGYIK